MDFRDFGKFKEGRKMALTRSPPMPSMTVPTVMNRGCSSVDSKNTNISANREPTTKDEPHERLTKVQVPFGTFYFYLNAAEVSFDRPAGTVGRAPAKRHGK